MPNLRRILPFLLVLLTKVAAVADGQELSPKERAIAERVSRRQADALALPERVVNVNSGTLNVDGVRAVGRIFADELRRLGFESRWVSLPDSLHRGGHLIATHAGKAGEGRQILLLGHPDTVFEPSSPFHRFERSDTLVRGPGVNA